MVKRGLKYLCFVIPVLGAVMKDLLVEDLSLKEVRTHFLLGEAHAFERAQWYDRSVKTYERILKRDPNRIPVFLNLGGLYYRTGDYVKAIPYYEKVIRMNPKNYQGHYWLAMCFWRLQRYYAAINTLEEVIEFLPTYKDALNLMGECYERIGESAKAEHYYLKAIRADPEGIVIHGAILDGSTTEKSQEQRLKH